MLQASFFTKVFEEAKRRLKSFYVPKCPFCENPNINHEIPETIIPKLNISVKFNKENSYIVFCDNKRGGCGLGFIIIKDKFQGGVHGFFVGSEQQYSHEVGAAKSRIQDLGLETHSFSHVKN